MSLGDLIFSSLQLPFKVEVTLTYFIAKDPDKGQGGLYRSVE